MRGAEKKNRQSATSSHNAGGPTDHPRLPYQVADVALPALRLSHRPPTLTSICRISAHIFRLSGHFIRAV